ncbi:hypothetical protein BGZ95_002959 [Linnemannia exigua]|uniref:Kelch repeat-containing protein n=1 Tax=Linnemannia exigua TaxID=604196 RepID=A0AAD4H9F1_9FUNG|nr:hypothetical protein BGZ95_002959 [Linnemannia exigua]
MKEPFTMLMASTLLILLSLLPVAYTQLPAAVPIPVEQFAFARAGPKAYMIGGLNVENKVTKTLGQVMSLDLSVSWKAATAPWQALAQVGPVYFINAVAAPDNQSIIVIKRGVNESLSFPTYRIATNAWDANPVNTGPVQESRQGIRPVMDPLTWNIYMNAWTYLDVFNTNTSTFQYLNMPANTFTSRFFAGSCYNKARHSLMYFGGLNGSIQIDPAATYVSEYSIGTNLWSNFTAAGTPPEPRADFCMAASEDGNRVVVFGGRIQTNTTTNPPVNFTGSFYILDTVTRQWTKGPDSTLRSYMGCLIVGDQFLAWGGSDGTNTIITPPIIFDFKLNQWVDTYTPPNYLLNWPKTPTTLIGATPTVANSAALAPPTTTPDSKANNLGAILGGTFGTLFVIAVSAMIYLFLKRREDKIKYGAPSDQQDSLDPDNDEKTISPAYLHSNSSTNSSQRNPHASDSRDPQDMSGAAFNTAGHRSVDATKDSLYPVGTHAFGNITMNAPTMLVSNSSFIPVAGGSAAFMPPSQAIYATGPNNSLYQVYNSQPPIQAHGMQSVAPNPTYVTSEGQPLMVSYGAPVYTLPMDPSGMSGHPIPVGFAPPFAQPAFANHSATSVNGSPSHAYPITTPPVVSNSVDSASPTGAQVNFGHFNSNTTAPISPVTLDSNNQTAPLQTGSFSPSSTQYITATSMPQNNTNSTQYITATSMPQSSPDSTNSAPGTPPSLSSLPPRPPGSSSNLRLNTGASRSSPVATREGSSGYVPPPTRNP